MRKVTAVLMEAIAAQRAVADGRIELVGQQTWDALFVMAGAQPVRRHQGRVTAEAR